MPCRRESSRVTNVVSSLIDNEGPVSPYLLNGFEQKSRVSIGYPLSDVAYLLDELTSWCMPVSNINESDPLLSHLRVIPAEAGLNSIGLNLNSRRLARRAEYMDVFCTKSARSRFTRHITVTLALRAITT